MSDEIDIEEHDVLDNPTLRRIFPDLSVIKKEISQYEEGLDAVIEGTIQESAITDSSLESESTIALNIDVADSASACTELRGTTQPRQFDDQSEVHLRFKKFLDSLADDIVENDTLNSGPQSTSHLDSRGFRNSTKTHNNSEKPLRNNMFVLGTKPNNKCLKNIYRDKRQLKIVLKNISPYLNGSNRYCNHCFILFPNINAFKYHVSAVHSLINNSTITNKKQLAPKCKDIIFQCEICTIKLSTKANLARHFKRVHNSSKSNKFGNEKRSLRGSTIKNETKIIKGETKTKLAQTHNCFHCPMLFDSQNSLIEHLYEVINPKKINSKRESNIKHSNIKADKNNLVKSKHIECSVCSVTFSTQSKLDEHKRKKHLTNTTTHSDQISYNNVDIDLNQFHNVSNVETNETNIQRRSNPMSLTTLRRNYKNISTTKNELKEKGNFTSASNHQTDDHSLSLKKTCADVINIQNKKAYQCYVCSQYVTYFKWYVRHMERHNIKDVTNVEKSTFDTQCKFCLINLPDIKAYNGHVLNLHQEKTKVKLTLDEKAFHSVLFKCIHCDVFFLSANAARNHKEHKEMFINWRCLDCQGSFKIKDKVLHLKQHILSKNITSHSLNESALNRVLYKCSKCAVHFSEEEYCLHYSTCDLEIPNSAYCNTCDILINRNDLTSHECHHKDNKVHVFDFTLIESDIMNNVKPKTIHKKINPHARSTFALTFCNTCDCFIGYLGKTRRAHTEGRCSFLNPRMCKKCGLILTPKGYISHKMLHDKVKSLSLQDFYFYDINSAKQIRPPIPKYPNCKICKVHFLNKQAFKEHVCSQQNFTTCNVCKIKLTEAAFKLHFKFHNYKLSYSALSKKHIARYKVNNSMNSAVSCSTANTPNTGKSKSQRIHDSNIVEKINLKRTQVLYTCITCQITIDAYDKMVNHCQDHYDYKEIQPISNKLYSGDKYEENNAITIKFDPFYFRFDNNVWTKHIFENLPEKTYKNILEDSMYKFECRLKMEEIQPGAPNLTLYKCDICNSYIAPNELYLHVSNTCTTLTRKYPCSVCGLCFYSTKYRADHEKVHESSGVNTLQHRIILYNKIEHQQFTRTMLNSDNKYILYQCRNCEGVVDKLLRKIHKCYSNNLMKCSYCGLQFCDPDYNSHIDKHKVIKHFQTEHIVVIKFGKLEVGQNNNRLNPSFSGTIYDLSFYKCINCGLCLNSKDKTSKHKCVPKSSTVECPKCCLHFLKKDLQEHIKLHGNVQLCHNEFNSHVIVFSNNSTKDTKDSLKRNENKEEKIISSLTQKMYKCSCGLHFLEELTANKHFSNCNPRLKSSKQSCFKCDLLFTPGELFNHLLKHHSDKKLRYTYDIITINKDNQVTKKSAVPTY